MANKLATITYTLEYTDSDSHARSVSNSTSCPYQSQNEGNVDVADTTASSTSFSVPFGAVANAFCVVVTNLTGQPLNVIINGSETPSYKIPDQGVYVAQAETDPEADLTVTSVDLVTTTTQSGLGLIKYKVLGDPV